MKRSRLQEMSLEITVGAFIFMVLLALGFFTIVLSRENLFQKSYRLDVTFEQVMGLREGDNVFVRGVDIGKIKELRVEPDGVHLSAVLDHPLKLRQDYRIEILPSSVLGGRYLNVSEGSFSEEVLAPDTPLVGTPPVDLVNEATDTISLIRKSLEDGEVLQNLQTTMANVQDITKRLKNGEGALGKLLTDDSVYDDIRQASSDLRAISGRLERGEGTLGKLMSEDDTLYTDLSDTVASLKAVSGRLERGEGTLGKLLSEDDTLYQDISASASNIHQLTDGLAQGKGTLGKLAQDDEMYEEIKLLLDEARAALDDIRETSPITTFSSVFFGAF